MLEKTLESPLDTRKIKLVKGNQPRIFIGSTDAEAGDLILRPPDARSRLTGKDPNPGKDRRQEEKGATEDEMLDSLIDSMGMNLSKLWEIVRDRGAWWATVDEAAKSRTQLSD